MLSFSLKYDPKVLKGILYSSREQSRKRRRVESLSDEQGMAVDKEPESTIEEEQNHLREREIVLETSKNKFLLSPSTTTKSESPKYIVALITDEEVPHQAKKPKAPDPAVPAEVQAKPPPPTWSTPPAELDSSRTKTSALPRKLITPKSLPMRKQLVAKVLSKDRDLEHFRFDGNEIYVEGLDNPIMVERWRWALVDKFVLN